MKRKVFTILSTMCLVTLSACGGASETKAITDTKEVEKLANEFYGVLFDEDQFRMSTFLDDNLVTVFEKDGDKYYLDVVEGGYDYYCFLEDGVKYVITDDRTLMEDSSNYDMMNTMIHDVFELNVLGYFKTGDENAKFTATQPNENELNIVLTTTHEGKDYKITSIGKKENNRITEIFTETVMPEKTYTTGYKFDYGVTIDLPEIEQRVSYNNLPHVDSPFKTFGEIIDRKEEGEILDYTIMNGELLMFDEVNGRQLQFSSVLDDETLEAFNNLDYGDEEYDAKANALLMDIEIEDCVDYTEILPTQDELDSYIGRQVLDLVEDGFEVTGYGFSEDKNVIFLDKNMMSYTAKVQLSEDFEVDSEFEYDAFYDFIVEGIQFNSPEYAILPLR